ncbi:hypothetical protein FB451DRAFT_1228430 [Mycena latifolia]|nr:hypothetical protein FB451DRAFT_1228430 [Mycena latifolia]
MAPPSETDDDNSVGGLSDASSTAFVPTIQDPQFPDDWDKFVHPNGSIYFYNPDLRLLTTDNVSNSLALRRLLKVHTDHRIWLNNLIQSHRALEDAEMLLFHRDDPAKSFCPPSITVASWRRGRAYDYATNADQSRAVLKSKSDFWSYVAQYPMHRTHLPPVMESNFLSALAFGANERIMDEKATTFPFEDTQILRLTQIYFDLKASNVPLVPALAYHIATVMSHIEKARARYGYGTPDARLYRDVAIPAPTWHVLFLDIPLGVLFCGTHKSYRTRLECTVPNGIVSLSDFRQLMQNMMAEWADSNLVATVFVSVNVGFLAVPGITALQRTSALVSSLCAMASIVTGLYHVWQHRDKTEAKIEDAINYIHFLPHCFARKRAAKPTSAPQSATAMALSLTFTACLLALPLATLQWSVLSFTVAIAAFTVGHGEAHTLLLALLILLIAFASAAFLFFWRIWRAPLHREMEEGLDPNVVDTGPEPDHQGARLWRARLKAVAKGVRKLRTRS